MTALHSAIQLSVVVSTCNRAADLARLFTALDAQTVTGRVPWELVLVDNRSADGTEAMITNLAARARFDVVSAYEGRPGKSHGLNTGVALVRGPLVAFTDDDAVPAPDWLHSVIDFFAQQPDAACMGGRVELFNIADAPVSIRPARDPRVVDLASFTPVNIPVIGCNMAVRASALRAAGPYDTDLGPGSRIGVAEDVDMLYRLVKSGHPIHYDPKVLVRHNHGRRTPEQVDKVVGGYVIGRGALYCKYALRRDRTMLRWAYWEMKDLLCSALAGLGLSAQSRIAWRQLRLLATGVARYLRYRDPAAAHSVEATRVQPL